MLAKKYANIAQMVAKKVARQLDPLASSDLRSISAQFQHFAKNYASIADEMDQAGIDVIMVKGVRTLQLGIERLNGSLTSAQRALMDARLSPKPVPNSSEPTLEEQASEARKKAERRKNR